MIAVLIFLAVLSVLVLGHEFGHYMAARLCKVKAEEFGYGFPPRAIGFVRDKGKWKKVTTNDQTKYANTIWSLNWLPLGGFVKLKGEEGNGTGDPDSFASKGVWARLFILAAGVMMNWVMAAMIFIIGFSVGIPASTVDLPAGAIVRDAHIEITDVVAGSAAAGAGILPGDVLAKVNGTSVIHATDAQTLLGKSSADGSTIDLELTRDHQTVKIETHAAFLAEVNHPALGIALEDIGTVRFPVWQAIGEGIGTAAIYTKLIFVGLIDLIRDLFGKRQLIGSVSGPVGIAVMTGQVAQQGWWSLLHFSALLSLNLAIVNFLPLPALDGGRALFVFVESLRRKKNDPNLEALVHNVGFILLLLLVVVVTFHDLQQYGGIIWSGLRHVVGL